MTGRGPHFAARFAHALALLGPLPSGARLIVALSGGSDSVALLGLLAGWRDRERPDVRLAAGHLDHRLRAESGLDAELCRGLAARFDLRAIIEEEDVAARAARDRVSVETAGREARLAAFRRWAESEGARAVLTAHHRDDQVETILAHLCRGAGATGLAGMAARRPLGDGTEAELWRPCLGFSRAELGAHRVAAGLPHREDATNFSLAPARNRIRHRLLPALRAELHPEIDARILALGAAAEGIARESRRVIAPLLESVRLRPPHAAIPAGLAARLRGEPALSSALFIETWRKAQGRAGALQRDHHRAWRRLVEGEGDARHYDLPRGASLERAGGWVLLLGASAPPCGPLPARTLPERGEIAWRGATIRCGPFGGAEPELATGDPWLAALLPSGPLAVRGAHPRDRLRVGGIAHRVGELLRAAGVPARWRGEFPVIVRRGSESADPERGTDGLPEAVLEEVLWVPGVRGPEMGGERLVRVVPGEDGDPIAFLLGLLTESQRTGRRADRGLPTTDRPR